MFTALQGDSASKLNDSLSTQGFRRSQNVLYRPSCSDCSACLSARIRVDGFEPNKTQRRTLKRNVGLTRRVTSAWATEAQYDLFRRYLDQRHADGGMADMDVFEFAAMIEETPIRTRVIEYSDTQSGELVAVCLTDLLEDGASMVYSFYAPDRRKDSLGTYVILDHMEIAREAGLPHVYLGYWVQGSAKMGYKSKFAGLEVFRGGKWEAFQGEEAYSSELNPASTDPIAEQVANISLPDLSPPVRR